jgi:hypothetical protein
MGILGPLCVVRVGSFGEGVIVVLAESGASFLFGEICEVFVPGFEVPLWFLVVELVGHV